MENRNIKSSISVFTGRCSKILQNEDDFKTTTADTRVTNKNCTSGRYTWIGFILSIDHNFSGVIEWMKKCPTLDSESRIKEGSWRCGSIVKNTYMSSRTTCDSRKDGCRGMTYAWKQCRQLDDDKNQKSSIKIYRKNWLRRKVDPSLMYVILRYVTKRWSRSSSNYRRLRIEFGVIRMSWRIYLSNIYVSILDFQKYKIDFAKVYTEFQ